MSSDEQGENKCLFCKIAAGEISSFKVASSDKCYAFLDLSPVSSGHTLVVPRCCARRVQDLPDDYAAAVMCMAKRIAVAVAAATGTTDCNIMVNNGPDAGQVIPHVHIHVIPRRANDGLWTASHPATSAASEEIAAAIREHLPADTEA